METISDLQLFIDVARVNSFAQAARDHGISRSVVSKRMARLEKRLGVPLMHRTTRTLALTPAGEQLVETCGPLLHQLHLAEDAVAAAGDEPMGRVRIAAPLAFGLRHVTPAIHVFCEMFPKVSVDVTYSDQHVDLLGEGVDLAIRGGQLKDSSWLAQRLRPIEIYLMASRQVLARFGLPSHPSDLARFPIVHFTRKTLTFQRGGERSAPELDIRILANNADARADAAQRHLGLAVLPDFVGRERTDLVRVLADWSLGQRAFWLIRPPGPPAMAVQRLGQHLVRSLGQV